MFKIKIHFKAYRNTEFKKKEEFLFSPDKSGEKKGA
jgi:hypothetical protein